MKIPGSHDHVLVSGTEGNGKASVRGKETSVQGRQSVQIRQGIQNKPVVEGKIPGKSASLQEKSGANKLTSLLSSLKLPQDNLSRSIVALARFFSLPLESKLLNSLRREALGPRREAAAQGSAAAADKGIKLGKNALNEYAAAIEGSIKSFTGERAANRLVHDGGQNPEHQDAGTEEKDGEGKNDGTGRNGQGAGDHPDSRKENPPRERPWDNGQELQRQIKGILNERPMLDLINRIPGKNGRWIVVPFYYCEDGFEFTVSLRMLVNNQPTAKSAERLTAEIQVTQTESGLPNKGDSRRWIITLERPHTMESFAEIRVFTEPGQRSLADKQMGRKLAKILDLPPEKVIIGDKQPLFADSRQDLLRSIDEEV